MNVNLSRRDMLLASFGLFAGGCANRLVRTERAERPQSWHEPVVVPPARPPAAPSPTAQQTLRANSQSRSGRGLQSVPRGRWTRSTPVARRVKPMNGIRRITVHHEGWKPFYATDNRGTARRLEQIRRIHVQDRGWGDIGYHYVIDRAGRLWQARPLHLQGAHVRDHNENNLGIMLLGNFDRQRPSNKQIDRLGFVLRDLMRKYQVPIQRVKTHQELMPTACPGQSLQSVVRRMRSTRYLA